MKKLGLFLTVVSILFATTCIAAETYTENFIKNKTQKIVDVEKNLQKKQAENQAKAKAQQVAREKKKAEVKAKIDAQKKKDAENKAKAQKKIQAKKDAWNTLISK